MIHPRKEADDTLLNISSVFGTAKATQEADNVIILQRVEGKKMVDIRKNRFDGDLGRFQIVFDQDSQLYRDELCTESDLVMRGVQEQSMARSHAQSKPVVEDEAGVRDKDATQDPKRPAVLDEIIMSWCH